MPVPGKKGEEGGVLDTIRLRQEIGSPASPRPHCHEAFYSVVLFDIFGLLDLTNHRWLCSFSVNMNVVHYLLYTQLELLRSLIASPSCQVIRQTFIIYLGQLLTSSRLRIEAQRLLDQEGVCGL